MVKRIFFAFALAVIVLYCLLLHKCYSRCRELFGMNCKAVLTDVLTTAGCSCQVEGNEAITISNSAGRP